MAAALILPPAGTSPTYAAENRKPEACDIQHGACLAKTTDGLALSFEIGPKPVTAMAEKKFKVTITGPRAEAVVNASVSIDLSMPGMVMGRNIIRLDHRGSGVYEGTGVIMRCMTGRKDWEATIAIERPKKKSIAGFRFEVQ